MGFSKCLKLLRQINEGLVGAPIYSLSVRTSKITWMFTLPSEVRGAALGIPPWGQVKCQSCFGLQVTQLVSSALELLSWKTGKHWLKSKREVYFLLKKIIWDHKDYNLAILLICVL